MVDVYLAPKSNYFYMLHYWEQRLLLLKFLTGFNESIFSRHMMKLFIIIRPDESFFLIIYSKLACFFYLDNLDFFFFFLLTGHYKKEKYIFLRETYIAYNNDNNQDELIINYNLLKNIVYESCTAYDKVFPPVTHFYRRSSSWPKSISSATATIFSFLIVLLPLKHSNADRKTIKATLHLM